MEETRQTSEISRRDFLRAATGGAFALAAGSTLAGCADNGNVPIQTHDAKGLYVSTYLNNTVERYNPSTGGRESTITTGVSPAVTPPGSGAMEMALGPDNHLWVANRFQSTIDHFNLTTGDKLVGVNDVAGPYGIAVGTDGILYVANVPTNFNLPGNPPFGSDSIERFDAITAAPRGTLAQVNNPFSLAWGPDNNLYVSTALDQERLDQIGNANPNSDSILRFSPTTGAQLNVVVQGDKLPFDILFTSRGTILVTEFLNNRIQEYNLTTGASVQTFAQVSYPIGLTFGPDGDLYVCSNTTPLAATGNSGTVVRLDANTGAFKQNFISNLPFAGFLLFVQ